MYRVLICGDRDWPQEKWTSIDRELRKLIKDYGRENVMLIHGAARGADSIAADVALSYGLKIEAYPAAWHCLDKDCLTITEDGQRLHRDFHGKAAGNIRNRKMLMEGKPHLVIGFHPNLAASKGTKDMLNIAEKAGIPTMHFKE